MKQKYTVLIADMPFNIVSDAGAEEMNAIVSCLNKRIKEILDKSNSCTKGEACVLAALSFCSDNMTVHQNYAAVDKDNARLVLENDRLKQQNEQLQYALNEAEQHNTIIKSLLSDEAETVLNQKSATDNAFSSVHEDVQEEESVEIPAEEPHEEKAIETSTPLFTFNNKTEKPNEPSSAVGEMFNHITYDD